eukprot:TRINITY_DN56062_c0_g1_i1.p1 TRINITY_DN56062_c0_g1~~TRINITY_DN56062_c0_g1_i1.p1  ORF type:complete len:111 (+),score=7.00 TRINITY_DN56062_c0_g1_i1:161-493(+)
MDDAQYHKPCRSGDIVKRIGDDVGQVLNGFLEGSVNAAGSACGLFAQLACRSGQRLRHMMRRRGIVLGDIFDLLFQIIKRCFRPENLAPHIRCFLSVRRMVASTSATASL